MADQTYLKRHPGGAERYAPMKEPRFAEIATFMRAPLVDSFDALDIALIGVPTDIGITNRPGARHGPREVRNASSLMRTINVATGVDPYALCRIADDLAPRAENVHFEDQLEGDRMVFDYRVRPGVVKKSNALDLMRAVGLIGREKEPQPVDESE